MLSHHLEASVIFLNCKKTSWTPCTSKYCRSNNITKIKNHCSRGKILSSGVTLICTRKQLQIAKPIEDIKSSRTLSYMWLFGHVMKLLGRVITIFIAKISCGTNFGLWNVAARHSHAN